MGTKETTTALKTNPHEPDFKRRVLHAGAKFIKHGTNRSMRARMVWITQDLGHVCWGRAKNSLLPGAPSKMRMEVQALRITAKKVV